jgi:hypothetical protein
VTVFLLPETPARSRSKLSPPPESMLQCKRCAAVPTVARTYFSGALISRVHRFFLTELAKECRTAREWPVQGRCHERSDLDQGLARAVSGHRQ